MKHAEHWKMHRLQSATSISQVQHVSGFKVRPHGTSTMKGSMPEHRTPHTILNVDLIGLDQLPEESPLPFLTTHERCNPLLSQLSEGPADCSTKKLSPASIAVGSTRQSNQGRDQMSRVIGIDPVQRTHVGRQKLCGAVT